MKISLKGITAEELSFSLNKVNIAPDQKIDIKPEYTRQIKKVMENEKLRFITLSVKIESTMEQPKPFNIRASLLGIYEVEDMAEGDEKRFTIEATKELYIYLRNAVANLTTQAYIAPLNLPFLNGVLFAEDAE